MSGATLTAAGGPGQAQAGAVNAGGEYNPPEPSVPQQQEIPEVVEKLNKWAGMANIASELEASKLGEIGEQAHKEYQADKTSMGPWLEQAMAGMELARQQMKEKNTPWPGASNVKLPLITSAVIKFAAEAYSELLKGDDWVKGQHPGQRYMIEDLQDALTKRTERVGNYMNYELQVEMDDWESDMDKLLHVMPTVGVVHKKTYYDPAERRKVSKLCLPDRITINQGVEKLDQARVCHSFELDGNDIYERVATGQFSETMRKLTEQETSQGDRPAEDNVNEFIEVHGFYDLDDDGYKEPYIVTITAKDHEVARIVCRFDPDEVYYNGETGMISRITPLQFFTKYEFLPSMDGSYWGFGWGHLMGPLTAAANTTINELLDAGALANMPGGFIDSRIRMEDSGKLKFGPNEFKKVRFSGPRLSDAIHRFDFEEPSLVLMGLLEFLVSQGKEISSVVDVVSDSSPANAPVGTTIARLEQAKKVFSSIYKRIYRAMSREFRVLYALSRMYTTPADYATVLNLVDDKGKLIPEPLAQEMLDADFEEDKLDLVPTANPELSSRMIQAMQSEALISDMPAAIEAGVPIDPVKVFKKRWESLGIENVEELFKEQTPEETERAEDLQMFEDFMRELTADNAAAELEGKTLSNSEISAKIQNLKAKTKTESKEPAKVIAETKRLGKEPSQSTKK